MPLGFRKKPSNPEARVLAGFWNPPFFYGWVIVAVVFLAEFAAASVGTLTMPLFFGAMEESLGWSLTQLVGAVTAQGLAYIAIAPFLGVLLDRVGARPIMLFGAVSAGVGLLLLMGVQEVWQFWVLYAIVGALGLHELGQFTGPVVVAKWFIQKRGRAMAIATLGTTVGAMVMAPVIGFLIDSFGWRQAWGILGIGMLVIMVPPILLFVRRQPEDLGLLPDGDTIQREGGLDALHGERNVAPVEITWTLKEAVKTRALWALIIASNFYGLATTVVVIHTVPFFTLQEGMSAQNAAYILTLRLVAATLSRLIWGFLVEKIPAHYCMAGTILSRSLGSISLIWVPYPYNIVTLLVTSTFGGAMGILQPVAFANYFGRTFFGTIQGTMKPFLSISSLLGPIIIAIMFDMTGTFDLAFLLNGALGFIGSFAALLAVQPVHPSLKDSVNQAQAV